MAVLLATLTKARDDLVETRASGARRFRDQNGEEVEFQSDAEMAKALAALDSEIARVSGRGRPLSLHFRTSKGT